MIMFVVVVLVFIMVIFWYIEMICLCGVCAWPNGMCAYDVVFVVYLVVIIVVLVVICCCYACGCSW